MSQIIKLAGMVDPHVHLRDLDWAHKATFASETRAAIAGGYWAVLDMPNTAPSTVTRATLDVKLAKIKATALCDWGLYFGASQAGNIQEFAHVPDVCGLKIYNNATTGDLLIESQSQREEIYQHWPSKVIAVHAEETTVLDILALVRTYRKHTHFCHISTANEIRYLTAAKEEGLPVSIGVTPHHLYLSVDDLSTLGAYGRMKPELKTVADRDALWQAIENGVVDVIESDHAPHTVVEKDSDTPPFGVPGLETNLPLMVLAVKENRISIERLVDLFTTGSHRIFNLHPDANTYTLIDFDAEYRINRETMYSACAWSPFEGMTAYGRVLEVWIRGTQVFDGENFLVEPGFGENLFGDIT